ncbi:MAG TPA: PHB depolymerase family esterase, partial [Lacipirellula sp.]
MGFRLPALCVLVLMAIGNQRPSVAANIADFVDFSLRDGDATLLPGRLYVPPEAVADPATPRPLVLFMHGSGSSGTDNVTQVAVSSMNNLFNEAQRRGVFLYAPQTNFGWTSSIVTDRVMTMVEQSLVEYNVDPRRLYVTGLSMGGGGTWNMLNRYGKRFAAGVPICGVTPGSDFEPTNFLHEATWAFHARNDGVVSVVSTRNVFDSIVAAAGQTPPAEYPTVFQAGEPTYTFPNLDVKYTDYRFGGHNIW